MTAEPMKNRHPSRRVFQIRADSRQRQLIQLRGDCSDTPFAIRKLAVFESAYALFNLGQGLECSVQRNVGRVKTDECLWSVLGGSNHGCGLFHWVCAIR